MIKLRLRIGWQMLIDDSGEVDFLNHGLNHGERPERGSFNIGLASVPCRLIHPAKSGDSGILGKYEFRLVSRLRKIGLTAWASPRAGESTQRVRHLARPAGHAVKREPFAPRKEYFCILWRSERRHLFSARC